MQCLQKPERAANLLELELQFSCPVAAGTQTLVLCKSNEYSPSSQPSYFVFFGQGLSLILLLTDKQAHGVLLCLLPHPEVTSECSPTQCSYKSATEQIQALGLTDKIALYLPSPQSYF